MVRATLLTRSRLTAPQPRPSGGILHDLPSVSRCQSTLLSTAKFIVVSAPWKSQAKFPGHATDGFRGEDRETLPKEPPQERQAVGDGPTHPIRAIADRPPADFYLEAPTEAAA